MPDTSPIAPNTTLKLVISWKEVGPAYDRALRKLANKIKSDGFRKGKMPLHLAEQMLGFARVAEAALDALLPKAYSDLIEAEKKRPLTNPDIKPIKVDKGEDWELEVQIAERPEIDLGKNYKAIVKKALVAAQKELDEQEKTSEKAKKPAKAKKTADNSAEADKAETTPPTKPLTEADRKDALLKAAVSALIAEIKPSIPELLVRGEARRDLEQLVKTLDQLNIKLESYLERRQQTFEQLSGELAGTALARLQLEFILQAIKDEAQIGASKEEIEARIGQIEDPQVRAEYAQNHEYYHYLESVIGREKTLDYLLTLQTK